MKLSAGLLAIALGFAAAFAAEPVADPLAALQRRRGTDAEARLSPSTQPAHHQAIEDAIRHGLDFMEVWQSPNGSWDRLENAGLHDKDLGENETEHVGDTCLAGGAMLKAVTSGRRPDLSKNCLRSVEFICGQVELWKGDTIYIQKRWLDPVHDKTPTEKEVRFFDCTVDTFWALDFLMEARDRLDNVKTREKTDRAISILLAKIEKAQDLAGTWPDETDPALGLDTRIKDPPRNAIGGPMPEWMREVEIYSLEQPNVVTHSMSLKVINAAARRNLPVKLLTLDRATLYFRKAFRNITWDLRTEPGYETSNRYRPRPILMTVWISTLYDCDLTARHLLQQARQRKQAGEKVEELPLLEKRAQEARTALEEAVATFKKSRVVGTLGPGAACLPDLIQAVRDLAPQESAALESVLQETLLLRQKQDGHFDSGSPRGDNTFGTATTLRALMLLADRKPTTQPTTQPNATPKGNG